MADTVASKEECMKNRVPLNWRDQCSGLLIPLNVCRHKNLYAPWACTDERHGYEKCQYDDMMRRMKVLSQQKSQDE
ncbi:hypothetical protein E3Q22_00606 [Wallemia mellicola]|uniref:NADH dehydrogenase [ubiquinone] 1 beta subcomplex subunit 7 n=2 Tax=Wallemia mellicola TaxID=1708541 RepID=A0A4T0P6P4_9BASI|nr:hypothetical protein WALSEDRAFT_43930 [Wallemia mellicola CBS 633.66]TIB72266.1 hypothetical protein E3Q24_01770 [Wallemia mellicola]EIM23014.1 hypothetical protein WALSEDRAFT_43930 [Wallemia mellicola CBS 633.66]TIB72573.1 hypothetical protein E3Q23_03367 [Wallemia mellicola]TIB81921.1 hypothetical protein E3Q22_00606 [Wallemia mellicola]TIB86122.1 hypothetical protein E3Q21_01791 [Wallemia mellicola]|eukprot:XP_006957053.1 hypothetical protein WALSEDRAFT_43930 [Wallemia mellicola CBS 633.66]